MKKKLDQISLSERKRTPIAKIILENKVVVHAKDPISLAFSSAFTNQGYVGRNRNFYGCDELYIYDSLFSLLNGFLNRE
ncbi:MAG: hypothetical protein EAS52_14565 [Parapedobacter sp.]|nr:MAG: hypothetical protein EAS52_14565 [Parapedobacter sp.]